VATLLLPFIVGGLCLFMFRPRSLVVAAFVLALGAFSLHAGDLRLNLPKRSKYTPVQKLNRDGVAAVEKHQYDKARKLFYEAYLIDPNDPFTLNNLGYLAELEGDGERARKFYELASSVGSDAIVDIASNDAYEGKPVSEVAGNAEDKGIRINRLNSDAIALLNKERAPEADLILQKALTIDPKNPFTLNNLGYAKEKQGETEAAYQFYTAAANTNSNERVEIAVNPDWRGQAIREVAGNNARKLNRRMRDDNSVEARVARLNLRGISAMNRNDRRTGRQLIEQAYKLNPNDAFTLNNMGYLAELDGDRETADHYYDRARRADSSDARIAMATRKNVIGREIGEVASLTDNQVLARMESAQIARQREGGPVALRRRDNSLVPEPDQPVARPQVRVSDANGNLVLPPRAPMSSPAPSQPAAAAPADNGGLAMPLPDNQQPSTVREGQSDGGLLMPLPEEQQPDAVQQQPGIASPTTVQPSPSVQQAPVPQSPSQQQPVTQQPTTQQPTYQPPASSQQPVVSAPTNVQPAPTTQQPQTPAQQSPSQQQPATQQPTYQPPASSQQPVVSAPTKVQPAPTTQQPPPQTPAQQVPTQQQSTPMQQTPVQQQQPAAQQPAATQQQPVVAAPTNVPARPPIQTPPATQTPANQQPATTQPATTNTPAVQQTPAAQTPAVQSPTSRPSAPQPSPNSTAPSAGNSNAAPAEKAPNGGLLLPPPDDQQPPATNTQPQQQQAPPPRTNPPQAQAMPETGSGVYQPATAAVSASTEPALVPAAETSTTPVDTSAPVSTTTTPAVTKPKRINDNDPRPAKKKDAPNNTGVKKITDRD
jgi:Flp pilus assembly protein TadD